MPGMDGVETTRRIKQISPRTQVVVLTSYHEDVHIFPALKAGAISYILKDMKMEKLVEALHRAAQKEVTLHPLVAARVLQNIRSENSDEQPLFTDLTERELDVLRLDRQRHDQQPDRREIGHQRVYGKGARQQHLEQTASRRPYPGGGVCLAAGFGKSGAYGEKVDLRAERRSNVSRDP